MKVSIVIPAFNEVQTIAEVLRRIAAADVDAEIVAAPLPAFRSWKMTVTP
ncbi:MAG TPA: glycosyltransferase [Patescibacteria group bacterium]|nr:glycosyltransferase [Patescibacteria group bacterium]